MTERVPLPYDDSLGSTDAVVGIIGAGQLARMMIEAATPLDLRIRLLAASPTDSAARIWPDVTIGSPDDPDAVHAFARTCDVITFDHELVPEPVLARLEEDGVALAPSAGTLRIAQNKQRQRELFAAAGLPQPAFRVCRSLDDARTGADDLGYPIVVKASHGGYDGRGVWVCGDRPALESTVAALLKRAIVPILEEWVRIDREHAIMIVRNKRGAATAYPLVETIQIDGICRQITFARNRNGGLKGQAIEIADAIATDVGLLGVMAVELLESDGRLLVNEIATRPHNSGHYSIEALETSQFEQHLRAVLNLPLGSTRPRVGAAVTVNVLGGHNGADPGQRMWDALATRGTHVHLYGKDARPGRKLGHVTSIGGSVRRCTERAWNVVEQMTGEERPEEVR